MHKILVINPGSTSTKIAVYEEEQQQSVFTIRHSTTEVTQYEHVLDQFDFRYQTG
ncbi:MAG: butyrate kinase [Bacteroidetes bacterium]|nr:butyrate kinase [Bacteroidota bacterium]